MRASLAIVAQAPLVARASSAKFERAGESTTTYQQQVDGVHLLGYLP
jgi:hypothetical protein